MNLPDPAAALATFVALDTGVLGFLTHPEPRRSLEALRCLGWLQGLVAREAVILLPEIADYEERREYLRRGSGRSLAKLDALKEIHAYQKGRKAPPFMAGDIRPSRTCSTVALQIQ